MTSKPELGVAMVGYSFMGQAHSQAWRTAPRAFDLPADPKMRVIIGRNREAASRAAGQLGWDEVETAWRGVLERPDIDIVDICTPSDTHAAIATAALDAGKHVMCEKPLANTIPEAVAMAAAAERARTHGVRSLVGFNYRRVPAITLAREWIAAGRIGRVYQARVAYLQDWLADPEFPLVWRLQRTRAGSGALGDIGSHAIDLAQFLIGEDLVGVSALVETFVRERPLVDGNGRGVVDVDDCALFTGRFAGGAVATFEATRFALGRKNALRIEINGSRASLAFDLQSLNELQFFDGGDDPASAGFRRILVTEAVHPYMTAWWPPGHIIGWEHTFAHQVADFVQAIAADEDPSPSFHDGLQVHQVVAAISESALKDSRWTPVEARASATVGTS